MHTNWLLYIRVDGILLHSKVHGIEFKKHVCVSSYEAIELCRRVSNMIT